VDLRGNTIDFMYLKIEAFTPTPNDFSRKQWLNRTINRTSEIDGRKSYETRNISATTES
jgi:hypothetical protein